VVHDVRYLSGCGLGEGAAEDGEVLGVCEDGAAVDQAVAGDDGVAFEALSIEAELGGSVGDEGADLGE